MLCQKCTNHDQCWKQRWFWRVPLGYFDAGSTLLSAFSQHIPSIPTKSGWGSNCYARCLRITICIWVTYKEELRTAEFSFGPSQEHIEERLKTSRLQQKYLKIVYNVLDGVLKRFRRKGGDFCILKENVKTETQEHTTVKCQTVFWTQFMTQKWTVDNNM